MTRSILLCNLGILEASDFDRSATLVSARLYDPRLFEVYTSFVTSVIQRRCPDVSIEAVRGMFASMLQLPNNANPRSLRYSQIQYFIGFASVHAGEPSRAYSAFEQSLRARPGASHAMLAAAHLATGGYYDEALHFADLALQQLDRESGQAWQASRVGAADIREFQAIVRADKEAAQKESAGRQQPE
jgi:hypothetical protein